MYGSRRLPCAGIVEWFSTQSLTLKKSHQEAEWFVVMFVCAILTTLTYAHTIKIPWGNLCLFELFMFSFLLLMSLEIFA